MIHFVSKFTAYPIMYNFRKNVSLQKSTTSVPPMRSWDGCESIEYPSSVRKFLLLNGPHTSLSCPSSSTMSPRSPIHSRSVLRLRLLPWMNSISSGYRKKRKIELAFNLSSYLLIWNMMLLFAFSGILSLYNNLIGYLVWLLYVISVNQCVT